MNRTTTAKTFALALPLVAGLLAGCQGVNAPVAPRSDPFVPRQIEISDPGLRRRTAFGEPIVTRDEGGNLLFITLPVRNTTNNPLAVEYRVTFFDPNGQPLPGYPTTWIPKNLPARSPDRITTNSTSPRAADFQIDFRYAK